MTFSETLQIRKTEFRGQPGFTVSGRGPNGGAFGTKIFVKRRETAEAIRDAINRGAPSQEIDQLILRENVQHEQRGPAQQTILAVVKATAPGVKVQLADIARRRELIGVPFKRLQSGAKALKNQGRIEYDGISQVWRESLNIDAMIEAVANGADPKTVLTEQQSKFVRFGFSSKFLSDALSALNQIGVENAVDRDRSSRESTLLLVLRVDMRRAADALKSRGVSFNIEGPTGLEPIP